MTHEADTLDMNRWLDLLDTTVNEVFESMLGMPCLPADPDLGQHERLKVMLSLSGKVQRNFCLYFSPDSAKTAVIAFTGDEAIEWEPLVDDALGEIGNIVIGSLKTKLDIDLVPACLSTPAISREVKVRRRAAAPGESNRYYAYLEHKLEIQLSFKVGEDSRAKAVRAL